MYGKLNLGERSSMDDLVKTLLAMSGQDNVVVIHKEFVKFTGSLEGGLLLGQLLYWTPRSTMGGWIAKTDIEFQEELSLSRYGLRQARSGLESMGFLKMAVKRFNGTPTSHYKIDFDLLEKAWINHLSTFDCTNSDNPLVRIQKVDLPDSDNPVSEIRQSLTEITTKTTNRERDDSKTESSSLLGKKEITYVATDDEGNELPPPKVKKDKTKLEAKPVWAFMQALSDVTGISIYSNRSLLAKVANEIILDPKASPELIRDRFGPSGRWYKDDWRGQKGQRPTPFEVQERLFALEDGRAPSMELVDAKLLKEQREAEDRKRRNV
jgi:hypothetical protein